MILQEHNTLANGMTIPKIGLGTGSLKMKRQQKRFVLRLQWVIG
mgnify:CR=1 FL=1